MASTGSSRLQHLLLVLVQLLRQIVPSQAQTERCSNGDSFPPVLSTCPIPINQVTAFRTGKWSPWSHRPNCNMPMDEYSPQYCLFTDDTFRGGHGISILTTAEIAADVAHTLDDSIVPPIIRDSQIGTEEVPYKFTDIPGRGKSTIATRKIKALERIMVDYPAVLTINDIEGADFDEIMGLLQRAVDQLPSQERETVYSLAQSNGDASPVRDIIRTNSFGLSLSGVKHMAVFPASSRMNHDCRPNTLYRLLPQALAQEVIAVRDIKAGEELTHSYAGHGMPYAQRRSYLEGWNFNCSCSLCTAPPKVRAESDRLRNRLSHVLAGLKSYRAGSKKLGEILDETLSMLKKEDLWFLVGNYYAGFAWAYLEIADLSNAKKYGKLAEEMGERYGQQEEVVQRMGNFWQTLKNT